MMQFSDSLKEAMALPTGSYFTPKLARLKEDDVTLTGMSATAITNATSEKPVIGTNACNPCCAMVAYNRKTKTAGVTHQPFLSEKEIRKLLSQVRKSDDEQVEVHIMGSPIHTKGSEDEIRVSRELAVDNFEAIIRTINDSPNVSLKTFDVYDKPKPHAVAIDARNGNLIRGSKLYVSEEEGALDMQERNMFYLYDRLAAHEDFDGTAPELQRPRKRG